MEISSPIAPSSPKKTGQGLVKKTSDWGVQIRRPQANPLPIANKGSPWIGGAGFASLNCRFAGLGMRPLHNFTHNPRMGLLGLSGGYDKPGLPQGLRKEISVWKLRWENAFEDRRSLWDAPFSHSSPRESPMTPRNAYPPWRPLPSNRRHQRCPRGRLSLGRMYRRFELIFNFRTS